MFFLRYHWTLPFRAQLAIALALAAALASARGAASHAEGFAALHHKRCMLHSGSAPPEVCVVRTIQLASHLHGIDFADEVAEALR